MPGMFDRESFIGKIVSPHIERMLLRSLKRNLHGVYLKGKLIDPPFVLAMNHHSFFDGHFVWLLFKLFGVRGSLLLSDENLRSFPVLEAAGALSTSHLREALRRLQTGEAVAIFPEGRLIPDGSLGQLKRGVVWLAEKAGVPILPVVSRVWLRGYENPEAFLLVGKPLPPDLSELRATLQNLLAELDRLCSLTHSREPFEGFSLILSGRSSLDERIKSPWRLFLEVLGLGN